MTWIFQTYLRMRRQYWVILDWCADYPMTLELLNNWSTTKVWRLCNLGRVTHHSVIKQNKCVTWTMSLWLMVSNGFCLLVEQSSLSSGNMYLNCISLLVLRRHNCTFMTYRFSFIRVIDFSNVPLSSSTLPVHWLTRAHSPFSPLLSLVVMSLQWRRTLRRVHGQGGTRCLQ